MNLVVFSKITHIAQRSQIKLTGYCSCSGSLTSGIFAKSFTAHDAFNKSRYTRQNRVGVTRKLNTGQPTGIYKSLHCLKQLQTLLWSRWEILILMPSFMKHPSVGGDLPYWYYGVILGRLFYDLIYYQVQGILNNRWSPLNMPSSSTTFSVKNCQFLVVF